MAKQVVGNGTGPGGAEQEAVYYAALRFTEEMDCWFEEGYHERDKDGQVILRLPDLVEAIEAGRWPGAEEADGAVVLEFPVGGERAIGDMALAA